MKIYSAIIGILLISLLVAVGNAQGASTTSSTSTSASTSSVSSTTTLTAEQALSDVTVTSVTVDPQEFYPYEQGTITAVVTNNGPQEVALKSADIVDSSNIYIPDELHNPYQTMMYLGPGTSMTFTFHVTAIPPEGIYYPVFSLASRDAGSIYFPMTVQIASTPLIETISQAPAFFAINNTDNVNLTITNPREGAIDEVIVTPSGSGFGISPLQTYIGTIPGDSSINVPFAVTPYQAGAIVNFSIQYSNGLTVSNPHEDFINMPLTIGQSKETASMDINDLALTATDGGYQLTGDVTNTGITDANGVVISVGSPAVPIEPYSTYAVGSLTSNDFSSFTLTFSGNDLSAIPIETTWKDDNGNTLNTVQTFDLRSLASALYSGSKSGGYSGSSGGSAATTSFTAAGGPGGYAGGGRGGGIFGFGGGRGGGLSAFYPVIIGGIVAIVAIVLYVKRKWILGKIKKQ